MKIVAPKVGGVRGSGGSVIPADGQLAGSPSVMFDAVVLVLADDSIEQMAQDAAAVAFVADAYSHLKVIGHTRGAAKLLQRANVPGGDGIVAVDSGGAAQSFLTAASQGRIWGREAAVRPIY